MSEPIKKLIEDIPSKYRIKLDTAFIYMSHEVKVLEDDVVTLDIKDIVKKIDELVEKINTLEKKSEEDILKTNLDKQSQIDELKKEIDNLNLVTENIETKLADTIQITETDTADTLINTEAPETDIDKENPEINLVI